MPEMTEKERRDLVLKIAWHLHGTPYIWGGDDPMAGFDCSGFVIETQKSVGTLPRSGDWTAQGMWDMWQAGLTIEPKAGDLVFWENSSKSKVIHVEIVWNSILSIGASGGGSANVTVQDAIDRNAYVKIRPFKSRSNLKGFLNPYI